jgi:tripartite-type tricarboxylate transporter receptor subunit TctC
VFAPAKTPRDIVQRLNEEISKALKEPGVKDKLSKLGVQEMPMTASAFDDYIRKELAQNADLVKAVGIKPE